MKDRHNSYYAPCIYYSKSTMSCDYILMADSRRPCPAGDGCTARRMRKDVKKMGKAKWDTKLGMQMWLEGKPDKEIAEAFGIAKTTVTSCRLKHWEKHKLPPQKDASPQEHTDTYPPAQSAPNLEKASVSMATPDGVYAVLEEATKTRSGIEAICTADAILCLWNWDSADDLRRARAAISYLIKRLEG